VTHLDWRRRRAFVDPSDCGVVTSWSGESRPYSFALSDAIRRVLLGADPPGVTLSKRAVKRLALVRDRYTRYTDPDSTVIAPDDNAGKRWWTFASARANAVLSATLAAVAPELLETGGFSNLNLALRDDATPQAVAAALRNARGRFGEGMGAVAPDVSERALKKLKFSDMLPPELARLTLAARSADHAHALRIARRSVRGPIDDG
jgi:ATP-dependent Lhr-like helicase